MGHMNMGHLHSAPSCRFDLTSTALVFGGLLVTASAICSTVDTAVVGPALAEEVKVVGDQGVIGPAEISPHALDCDSRGKTDQPAGEVSAVILVDSKSCSSDKM